MLQASTRGTVGHCCPDPTDLWEAELQSKWLQCISQLFTDEWLCGY